MIDRSEDKQPTNQIGKDVGKNNNIIEINGKRYDARTGALLSVGARTAATHITDIARPHTQKPEAAKPIPVQSTESTHNAAAKQPKPIKKALVHDAVRQAAMPKPKHKQQPSRTLMRTAVKKPQPGLKRRIKVQTSADALAIKPAAHIQPKRSARHLDDRRLRHATNTPKSQAVSRFSKSRGINPAPPTHVPVPGPKPHTPPAHGHHIPVNKPPAKRPQTTAELLERALQQATSHLEPAPATKKRRGPNRLLSFGTVAAAFVILGGFVAFQNINNVKLQVASSKAGFTASLPDYQPAGYRLSHLNYGPGTVSLKYQSNTDNRTYAITEKSSAWNSEALRDSFLASSGKTYRTVESGGRTLFLYGSNAATWVSGGVWYQVQSDGTLSDRQLIQLATSM